MDLHSGLFKFIREEILSKVAINYTNQYGLVLNPHSVCLICNVWCAYILTYSLNEKNIIGFRDGSYGDEDFDGLFLETSLFHLQQSINENPEFNFPMRGLHSSLHSGFENIYKFRGGYTNFHKYGVPIKNIRYCDVARTYRNYIEEHLRNFWGIERPRAHVLPLKLPLAEEFINFYPIYLCDNLFRPVRSNYEALDDFRDKRWRELDAKEREKESERMFRNSRCPWWEKSEKDRDLRNIYNIYREALAYARRGFHYM